MVHIMTVIFQVRKDHSFIYAEKVVVFFTGGW
jgi:hypothetical protein